MAYHFNDNVHTTVFTPREPQLELLDEALKRNILICMCKNRNFIASKLVQEVAIRCNDNKTTLYITNSSQSVSRQTSLIRRLTDLRVQDYIVNDSNWTKTLWREQLRTKDVLVMSSSVAAYVLHMNFIAFTDLNLIVLHDCLAILNSPVIRKVSVKENYWSEVFDYECLD